MILTLLFSLFLFVGQGQSKDIKDLKDGFQQKTHGENILIHFPDKCMVDVDAFKGCISIALVKSLGCDEFEKCLPDPTLVKGEGMFVETISKGKLQIYPLQASDDDTSVVGIVYSFPAN